MSEYKNQHFVPRCHLKPFSDRQEGKSICLILFKNERPIKGAPVKNQCSKNFFYGDDLEIEKELGRLEGKYAEVMDRICRDAHSKDDLLFLRHFSLFQFSRTEQAVIRYKNWLGGLTDLAFAGNEEQKPEKPSDAQILRDVMSSFIEMQVLVDDLKPIILHNETMANFITSDDPVSFCNKFMAQRHPREAYGISSSGLCITMPLSPKLFIISLDPNVYSINGSSIRLRNEEDIFSLNSILMKKESQTLFFDQWNDRDRLSTQMSSLRDERRPLYKVQFLVEDRSTLEGTRFRALRAGETREQFSRGMVVQSHHYPNPTRWMSFLKYRNKPKVHYNGTGVGYVRKREWLNGNPLNRRT